MTVQDVINVTLATQQIEIYEETFLEISYIGVGSSILEKYRNCPVLCMEVIRTCALRLYIS